MKFNDERDGGKRTHHFVKSSSSLALGRANGHCSSLYYDMVCLILRNNFEKLIYSLATLYMHIIQSRHIHPSNLSYLSPTPPSPNHCPAKNLSHFNVFSFHFCFCFVSYWISPGSLTWHLCETMHWSVRH